MDQQISQALAKLTNNPTTGPEPRKTTKPTLAELVAKLEALEAENQALRQAQVEKLPPLACKIEEFSGRDGAPVQTVKWTTSKGRMRFKGIELTEFCHLLQNADKFLKALETCSVVRISQD